MSDNVGTPDANCHLSLVREGRPEVDGLHLPSAIAVATRQCVHLTPYSVHKHLKSQRFMQCVTP
jgi:hypothetical protein